MARKQYNVTPEAFIRAWQESESAQEVSDKLKMPKAIVLARASSYRQEGVKLRTFKRGAKRTIDVAALNKLIDELNEDGRQAEADVVKRLLERSSEQ